VEAVQARLNELGFPVGTVDGNFGGETEAGVMAFQLAYGLRDDGVVGPLTFAELDVAPSVADVAGWGEARKLDWVQLRAVFPYAAREAVAHYEKVTAALMGVGLWDGPMHAMALGTVAAETSRFEPISEGVSRWNTSGSGHPFDRYDFRGDLGNGKKGDGAEYKGRGFIQVTGKANYRDIGAAIGEDLLENPALANEPMVAAKVLAMFLKRSEGRIRSALVTGDLARARKVVNGGRHGLDRFERAYRQVRGYQGY
jgi:peptidoglycan L-alanyl-D-glutamate endopeptidase CwlK